MGNSKSKIPALALSQKFKLTGIPEYDTFYSQLEPIVKVLHDLKSDLDQSTTKLIQSLHIQSLWELDPNIETIFQIILTILAVAGKGNIQNVAQFSVKPSYIKVLPNTLKRDHKTVIENFELLSKSICAIEDSIIRLKISKKNIPISTLIQSEIASKVIQKGYSMKEKIEAIANVNHNHKIIEEIPEIYLNLSNFSIEFTEKLLKVFREAQVPPLCDILIVRSIQSIAANQNTVKKIVKNFWKII